VVGQQNAALADTLQLRDVATATIFWLLMGYNFGFMIASNTPFGSRVGFRGQAMDYQKDHGRIMMSIASNTDLLNHCRNRVKSEFFLNVCQTLKYNVYTWCAKNGHLSSMSPKAATLFLPVTSPNADQFS